MQKTPLDQKDRRIIAALDENARLPVTAIARKAGLSKQSAAYRLERLQNEGILKQALAVVDLPRLGYTGFQLYVKLCNVSKRREEALVSFVKNHQRVVWGVRCTGNWDLLVLFAELTPADFQKDLKQMLAKFGQCVAKKAVSIYLTWEHLSHKYITGEQLKSRILGKQKLSAEIDEEDEKILAAIATEARKSIVEISVATKIPASTVAFRLKELQKTGVITGFAPQLDFHKTGYQYSHIMLKLRGEDDEKSRQLTGYLERQENVVYLVECVGEADLELEAHVRNPVELQKLLFELRGSFGSVIESDETAVVFDVIKYDYFPFKASPPV